MPRKCTTNIEHINIQENNLAINKLGYCTSNELADAIRSSNLPEKWDLLKYSYRNIIINVIGMFTWMKLTWSSRRNRSATFPWTIHMWRRQTRPFMSGTCRSHRWSMSSPGRSSRRWRRSARFAGRTDWYAFGLLWRGRGRGTTARGWNWGRSTPMRIKLKQL